MPSDEPAKPCTPVQFRAWPPNHSTVRSSAAARKPFVPRWLLSAPLFANKLLRRAAEIASAATRSRRGICRYRRGGRNAGILAVHCLRVAIDLTCKGCRVYGRRCDGHRIHGLTGLSENFGCKRRAIEQHERRQHNACHETSPYYAAALQDRHPRMVAQIEPKNHKPAPPPGQLNPIIPA